MGWLDASRTAQMPSPIANTDGRWARFAGSNLSNASWGAMHWARDRPAT